MTPSTIPTTRRANRFFRLLSLTALVAVSTGVLVGSAPSVSAALTVNGLPYNGTSLQGVALHETSCTGGPLQSPPLHHCVPEATQLDSEMLPPASAGRLPWHRLSHTPLGQR